MSNITKTIEDAASPEEFISALRNQADKCRESASELASVWQDRNAGKFWDHAGRALDALADKLAKVAP